MQKHEEAPDGNLIVIEFSLGIMIILTAVSGCLLGMGVTFPILWAVLGLAVLIGIIVLAEKPPWRLAALSSIIPLAIISGVMAWVVGAGIDQGIDWLF